MTKQKSQPSKQQSQARLRRTRTIFFAAFYISLLSLPSQQIFAEEATQKVIQLKERPLGSISEDHSRRDFIDRTKTFRFNVPNIFGNFGPESNLSSSSDSDAQWQIQGMSEIKILHENEFKVVASSADSSQIVFGSKDKEIAKGIQDRLASDPNLSNRLSRIYKNLYLRYFAISNPQNPGAGTYWVVHILHTYKLGASFTRYGFGYYKASEAPILSFLAREKIEEETEDSAADFENTLKEGSRRLLQALGSDQDGPEEVTVDKATRNTDMGTLSKMVAAEFFKAFPDGNTFDSKTQKFKFQ